MSGIPATMTYYSPDGGTEFTTDMPHWLMEPSVLVGSAQLALMLRARRSAHGQIVLTHGRSQNAERMAARRLVERKLLSGPNFVGRPGALRRWRDASGGSAASGLYVYTLTERGRTCWLRSKEKGAERS